MLIETADGFRLHSTLFEQPSPKYSVLIQSATGVKRQFYSRYAQYLQSLGCAVLTYDYRGVGGDIYIEASIGKSWAIQDQGAATKYLLDRYPSLPLMLICHSVGCHITPMNPHISKVHRVLFVSGNSAYWGYAKSKVSLLAFPLYVQVTTNMFGYFPASKIKLCDDLPSGIGRDWSRWSRQKEYCTVDTEIKEAYSKYNVPSLSLCFSDDHLCYYEAFKSWVDLLPRKTVELQYRKPSDFGLTQVDHMGYFMEQNKDALWKPYTQWLLSGQDKSKL